MISQRESTEVASTRNMRRRFFDILLTASSKDVLFATERRLNKTLCQLTNTVSTCLAAFASQAAVGMSNDNKTDRKIVFVLGGPGAGKGTQCEKLIEDYDLVHLSAGELLRAHITSGSSEGKMVQEMINQGQIVPSQVTVGLLEKAMAESGRHQFLIDGFPRNEENQQAFVKYTGTDCEFVLFFECPEDVMIQRLLSRNQGRSDDNIDTIKKRFKVFLNQTMPVVQHYDSMDRVRRVDATKEPETVYKQVMAFFASFVTKQKQPAGLH